MAAGSPAEKNHTRRHPGESWKRSTTAEGWSSSALATTAVTGFQRPWNDEPRPDLNPFPLPLHYFRTKGVTHENRLDDGVQPGSQKPDRARAAAGRGRGPGPRGVQRG